MAIQYDYATLRQLGQGGIRDALQQSDDRQWQGRQRAMQAETFQASRDKAQTDLRDQQAAKQLKLLASIADLPEDRQAAVYAAVRPTAQKLNPGYELPEQYDPAVVQFARNQAIGPEKLAEPRVKEQSANMTNDYRTQMLDYRQLALDTPGGGKAPAGYRWAPDGSQEPVPGGPHDPAVKTKGLAIPGYEFDPAAPPAPADAKELKSMLEARSNLKAVLAELGELTTKHGSEFREETPVGTRMSQLYQQAKIQIKELEALGAIQAADVPIIEGYLANPLSLARNVGSLFGQNASMNQSYADLDTDLDRRVRAKASVRGYKPAAKPAPAAAGGWKIERLD